MNPLKRLKAVFRRIAVPSLAAACAVAIGTAQAEDIDIFTGNNSSSKPNVLIIIDSSSNWSATLGSNTCNTGNMADNTKFAAEICALTTVIGSLGTANVRIGLMMFAETGTNGAYVRYGLRDMNTTNKTAFVNELKGMIASGSGTDNSGSNQPYGKTMFEAFKYFGGYTSPAHATDGVAGTPTGAQAFGNTAFAGGNSNNSGTFRRDYPNNNTPSNRAASFYGADSNNAYVSNNSDLYTNPVNDGCAKNFIIFISNGNPSTGGDSSNPTATTLLTAVGANLNPITNSAGTTIHASLFDEAARFLYTTDVSSQAGQQRVITYTIAVYQPQNNGLPSNTDQGMIDLMKSGANVGGGKYFAATQASDVSKAIDQILNEVQAENSVFVSASLPVSVNTQGTYLNQVYMGMFRPDGSGFPRWLGNLKQYKIDQDSTGALFLADSVDLAAVNPATGFISPTAKSFWSAASTFWANSQSGTPLSSSDLPDGEVVEKGGAAEQIRTTFAASQSTRTIYTCASAGCTAGQVPNLAFNTTNISGSSYQTAFGVPDATSLSNLVNWIVGADNVNGTPASTGWTSAELGPGWPTTIRPSIHGDVLHSRPVVLNYSSLGPYVFYGANDGTLRGTKGGRLSTDGNESWAFVAPEFFGKFNRLRNQSPLLALPGITDPVNTPTPKDYFFDGSMGSYQSTDLATEYIFATARRGGRVIYAFDVSIPTTPKFMWKVTNATSGMGELGQTWSEPVAFKVKASTDPVVMFAAGYDPAEDSSPAGTDTMGRGIYVLNARTGALLKFFQTATNGGSISSAVPSDVTVLDTDGDTLGDRAYVGDMAGNIWRMDIDDPDPANWKLFKFAALGSRKFFFPPDVIVSRNFDLVMIGSGDREKPLDTTSSDNFYMLKDTFVGKDATGMVAIVPTDLVAAGNPVDSVKGWYLALLAGEKVINAPLSIAGTTFFSTNQPSAAAGVALGTCAVNLGVARAYAINSLNGTAAIDRNGDGTKNSSDLSTVLTGGGLPPSPVGGVVQLDNGKKVDFIIGSGAGGSPISPAIPPRTVPTVRKKVYWNTQTDG